MREPHPAAEYVALDCPLCGFRISARSEATAFEHWMEHEAYCGLQNGRPLMQNEGQQQRAVIRQQ